MTIEREDRDGVAVVRLAHGKVNALDVDLCRAITATFRDLDAGDQRAVVVTGAGRAFSAGVDLWRIADGGEEYVREFLPALVEAFEAVFGCGKPVVAAVNGHAIACGCIIACAADRRVMSGGRIGVTELLVGVPFPATALAILDHALGPVGARRAVFSAETFEPVAALAQNLVDEVTEAEHLLDRAVELARRDADLTPADTYRLTKRQLQSDIRGDRDADVTRLWIERVADGHIRRYMEQVTARK